jgi:hypothetical protein
MTEPSSIAIGPSGNFSPDVTSSKTLIKSSFYIPVQMDIHRKLSNQY